MAVGGGGWGIKDNTEAGASSREHHSPGRGSVPRKQRTPTRAPAPTASRLASQLLAATWAVPHGRGRGTAPAAATPLSSWGSADPRPTLCVFLFLEELGRRWEQGWDPHAHRHRKPSRERNNPVGWGVPAPGARWLENAGS